MLAVLLNQFMSYLLPSSSIIVTQISQSTKRRASLIIIKLKKEGGVGFAKNVQECMFFLELSKLIQHRSVFQK